MSLASTDLTGLYQASSSADALTQLQKAQLAKVQQQQRAAEQSRFLRQQLQQQQAIEAEARRQQEFNTLRQVDCKLADGTRYWGEFLHGLPQGQGTIETDKGNLAGTYEKGLLQGDATLYNREGHAISTSQWKDGKLHGWTVEYRKHKKTYRMYAEGVLTGCYKEVYTNGDVFVRDYVGGAFDPKQPGTYVSKDRKYRGRKSKLTPKLWKWIGGWWSTVGAACSEPKRGFCADGINGLAALVLSILSLAVTVVGAVVSPIPLAIDGITNHSRGLK